MAIATTLPEGDRSANEAWRFVFELLAAVESNSPAKASWPGPDVELDLQSRVWFLASSLGYAPLGSRVHLGRIVAAWHAAGFGTTGLGPTELRRIARECLDALDPTVHSRAPQTRAVMALGARPIADAQPTTPSAAAQQLVDTAVAAWLEEISSAGRWSTLPLLGGIDALPLDEVHVELLVQPVSHSDELAADFARLDRRDRSQPLALGLSIRQVLARAGRQVLIIGEPGAGKSTTVKWIVRAIATNRVPEFDATIAVSLGAYAESVSRTQPSSLVGYFLRTHLPSMDAVTGTNLEAAAELVAETNRTRNRVLLLLDGWDEVPPSLRDQVRDQIQAANKSFVTLITSRPSGVPQRFVAQSHGIAFRFSGLSPSGVHQLAVRIFGQRGRPELAAEFQELLRHEADLETFVRNPFLNTLICLLFAETSRATLLEFVHTPARLYDRITEWIAAQYNGRPETQDPLGAKHWRILEALSHDLLVTSPRPRYVFRLLQVESLAAQFGVSATPVTAARFLQHIGTVGDEHSFLHATLQEYFAARGLDEEFAGDAYRDVILRLLPARDYAEVLRFAAGGDHHRSEFWRCVREWGAVPDRFHQIACQLARLVAASGERDGGQAALGRDVRRQLWVAIADPLQHPNILEQCVDEYIALDALDLVQRTVEHLDAIPDFSLQFVLLNVPRAVAVKQQLYAAVDQRRADFHGWTNPRAVSAAEIAQRRDALLASDNAPARIRDLCWELGNFRDEQSAPRILELLTSGAAWPEDTFENMVFALAAIGTRAALDGLIDLLFVENASGDHLWRIERELREPHVLDPEGRDRNLRRVAALPSTDPRVALGLV